MTVEIARARVVGEFGQVVLDAGYQAVEHDEVGGYRRLVVAVLAVQPFARIQVEACGLVCVVDAQTGQIRLARQESHGDVLVDGTGNQRKRLFILI